MSGGWRKLAHLWERPGKDGGTVLVGRVGKLRIVIVKRRDGGSEESGTHDILFCRDGDGPRDG